MKSKQIAVVGQGVIGLTCASRLLDEGHSVTVYSREEFGDTTSMAAGAYWWPHQVYPEEKVLKWAKETYEVYAKTRDLPGSGITFERHLRFCLEPDECGYVRNLVDDWEEIDATPYGIPCREAFRLTLPVIDVPVFLPRLKASIESRGAVCRVEELQSPAQLFPGYDLVINCSGVWARHFVGDEEVFPIRGHTVRVSRPTGLRDSMRVYGKAGEFFTLILPRGDDVILGGTSRVGDWDRTPRSEDTGIILGRCAELLPQIARSKILGAAVGLRPGRKEVRLELEISESGEPVIHNYGHGGGGFTLAWGCAGEVARIAHDYFSNR